MHDTSLILLHGLSLVPSLRPLRPLRWLSSSSASSASSVLDLPFSVFLRKPTLSPLRRRRLLHHALDRLLPQQPHRLRDGALELRIASLDHFPGIVLHLDVRPDALVLDREPPLPVDEPEPRRDHRAAIHEWRRIAGGDEAAPCSRSDERPDLTVLEHERQQVSAGA